MQICVLKVNIHCNGCKQKVKKILQKIDGVYTIKIDAEQGKVTVSGNVDPAPLIKKLMKSGKHAELWGAQKSNDQLKNMRIDNGKGGNKGQKGGGGVEGNNQPKVGQNLPNQQQLQHLNQQQLQQLQQMKAFQDLKLPQFKDLKMPSKDPGPILNQKGGGKFILPEDEEFTDEEWDYDEDDNFMDDEDFDDYDDAYHQAPNKTKPMMGNCQMPNMMMILNEMMNGNHAQQLLNAQEGGGNVGGSAGNNGKKGGGGGKNGARTGNGSGGSPSGNINGNGGKKGGGMENGFLHVGGGANGSGGQMGGMKIPMGHMGSMPSNFPAVPGLPDASLGSGGRVGGANGYFPGARAEAMPGNPYQQQQQQQQQYLALLMNHLKAMGDAGFQPMMYAWAPTAINYMWPYPYLYPGPYAGLCPCPCEESPDSFSDENTSSCNVP
ncbi:hypothetical protein EUGRSUZ_H03576 [Eucalyptus grandis]|uniref:Uncharacterized protein n=4 Tax=Eucalyptus grandis TaxID=71139 RepID=A0ACC3JUM0_EUCGR|nr:hypothetical protein EUGRSUZ_H03576 [Eucalyptus grandis]